MQWGLQVHRFFFLSTQVIFSACDMGLSCPSCKTRAGPQQGLAAKLHSARQYFCDSVSAPWLHVLATLHVSPTSYISLILPGSFTHGKLGACLSHLEMAKPTPAPGNARTCWQRFRVVPRHCTGSSQSPANSQNLLKLTFR